MIRVTAASYLRRSLPGRWFWLTCTLVLLLALAIRQGWTAYLPEPVQQAGIAVAAVLLAFGIPFGIPAAVAFWIALLVWRGLKRVPHRCPMPLSGWDSLPSQPEANAKQASNAGRHQ